MLAKEGAYLHLMAVFLTLVSSAIAIATPRSPLTFKPMLRRLRKVRMMVDMVSSLPLRKMDEWKLELCFNDAEEKRRGLSRLTT